MNQPHSYPKSRPGQSEEPERKWVLVVITMIGLGAVALLVVALQNVRGGSSDAPVNSASDAGRTPASSRASEIASARAGPEAKAARSWPEPSDDTRQMVKGLAEIDVRPGALTPEKAAAWQRNMGQLLDQGTAAVPALAEFFERNEDVRFDLGPGPNLLGEPTLRIAFLKVLFDIPDPDNVDLQEQVLRTTRDPDEIAVLARQLELQEPGKYQDAIIEAAKAALSSAGSGNVSTRQRSMLLKLLKQFEESSSK